MPTDVQNVIDPPHDPKIAILISAGAIAGEVTPFDLAPVLFFVTWLIAPDCAQHRRPRFADNEFASHIGRNFVPLVIDYRGVNAKKWQGRRPRLKGHCARQRRNDDRSRLSLPPRIDNWAATTPDDRVIPHPCLRINWFSHCSEQPEGG